MLRNCRYFAVISSFSVLHILVSTLFSNTNEVRGNNKQARNEDCKIAEARNAQPWREAQRALKNGQLSLGSRTDQPAASSVEASYDFPGQLHALHVFTLASRLLVVSRRTENEQHRKYFLLRGLLPGLIIFVVFCVFENK
jgi:hypothetical protein